ncbi:DUF2637 domain-containing protein [Actinomadura hibisca]|uniref:DUF2637 domain-containing protein n=1 Tax=Actinomadura hibisca TaxID=68565 RepID=UPI000830E83E|nr:DUF2637 domain-containing protein [Actinomadura hibisca]
MHDGSTTDQPTPAEQEHAPSTSDRPVSRRITADHLILTAAALSFVASISIAAVISYKHAHRFALAYGQTGIDAQTFPLTVDGLVATCSLVILNRIRKNRRPPWHAWALLIVGIIATVSANVHSGLAYGPIGAIVAGWPALVAVGSFELLMRLLHDTRTTPDTQDRSAASAPSADPAPLSDQDGQELPDLVPDLVPEIVGAALRYAGDLAEGAEPSIRRLKRELHIGHSKAARIHQALTARIEFPPEPHHPTEEGKELTPAA